MSGTPAGQQLDIGGFRHMAAEIFLSRLCASHPAAQASRSDCANRRPRRRIDLASLRVDDRGY
jgi:hypothetical protein